MTINPQGEAFDINSKKRPPAGALQSLLRTSDLYTHDPSKRPTHTTNSQTDPSAGRLLATGFRRLPRLLLEQHGETAPRLARCIAHLADPLLMVSVRGRVRQGTRVLL